MSDEQVIKKIEDVLQDILPNIQMDGGDIEFVSFSGGTLSLKFCGAFVNYPQSFYNIKLGIEEQLKQYVPDIYEVVSIKN